MKKIRFTEVHMVGILQEADRLPVTEVSKKHGICDQTIYNWRKHFSGMNPADLKRFRQFKPENNRLRKLGFIPSLMRDLRRLKVDAHWRFG